MKKLKLDTSKLKLGKTTIAILSSPEMNNVAGGDAPTPYCATTYNCVSTPCGSLVCASYACFPPPPSPTATCATGTCDAMACAITSLTCHS